jgi:acetyl esterase
MAAELHPDAQAFLDTLDRLDLPEKSEVSVEELRAQRAQLRTEEAGMAVGSVEDRTIPGPEEEIPVRIYRPEGEGPFPVVTYFHGGGFALGDLESHDTACRELTNASEAAVVSVEYRLAPEHPFPAAVEDAYGATEWVSENAAVFDGDTDRVAVAGDSAGGNLAAIVALMARDYAAFELAYQLLVYPAVSFDIEWPSYEANGEGYFLTTADMEWYSAQYAPSPIHARNPYAAPMKACDLSDVAPATVVTAGFDPLRDEGIAYADRLAEDGVETVHRHYEGMIHGFYSMLDEPVEIGPGHDAIETTGADLKAAFERAA